MWSLLDCLKKYTPFKMCSEQATITSPYAALDINMYAFSDGLFSPSCVFHLTLPVDFTPFQTQK